MAKITAQTAPKIDSRPMTEEADFLQIKAIDHVHFYVGNAKHAMYYWWKAFGFKPVAYSGLETGNREFASYVSGIGAGAVCRFRRLLAHQRDRRASHGARRRRQGHCPGSGRRRKGLAGDHFHAAANPPGRPASRRMTSASSAPPPFTPTARPCTSSWIAATTRASSLPPIGRSRIRKLSPPAWPPSTTSSAMCRSAR